MIGWLSKKRIDLPKPTANQVGFPVKVPIIADAVIGAGCLANGFDIRFTTADETTLLPYERESFAVAGGQATAIFWVKSDVAMAGTYIWCYYGNAAAADGQNATAVWDANFKAVYHMKDATTSTILDSTVNDNDGAKLAANEPIEADGKIGKGQDFDGSNDYIDIGTGLAITTPMSVSGWINIVDDKTLYHLLIAKRDGSGCQYEFYVQQTSGKLSFYNGATEYPGTAVIGHSQWVHVAMALSAAVNGTLIYYINGVPDKSTDNVSIGTGATNLVVHLGDAGEGAGASEHFMGVLDEVHISSIARPAEWIAYEYANMNPADGGLTWGAEESVANAGTGLVYVVKVAGEITPNPIHIRAIQIIPWTVGGTVTFTYNDGSDKTAFIGATDGGQLSDGFYFFDDSEDGSGALMFPNLTLSAATNAWAIVYST